MITTNVEELLKSLKAVHEDTVRRLENMVRGFMYEFALTAVDNTPLGDSEKYAALYKRRQYTMGLEPIEGFAQGSWQVPEDINGTLSMLDNYSGDTAAKAVRTHMMNYKLGETVSLGNKGPYIGYLEGGSSKGQAPDGIMKPTIDQVLSSYKIDLQRYYKA